MVHGYQELENERIDKTSKYTKGTNMKIFESDLGGIPLSYPHAQLGEQETPGTTGV